LVLILNLMDKIKFIIINAIPILIMIGLIPLVLNDYILALIYVIIIAAALLIKRNKNDLKVLVLGFFVMIIAEYVFISTGVETFQRNSLFGVMPLWLPFLWSYGFVAIRRLIEII